MCDFTLTQAGKNISPGKPQAEGQHKVGLLHLYAAPRPQVYQTKCFCPPEEGEVTCLPSVGWCHRATVFFAV